MILPRISRQQIPASLQYSKRPAEKRIRAALDCVKFPNPTHTGNISIVFLVLQVARMFACTFRIHLSNL
ncbi:hypothetical protein BDV33DRAFT_137460 [Aspergillus novoparasiticus]|uniref:Uncharacterized protein n=1 Tax=Aspergillus novoparasiticus TaxID=986946 RepID=A0A5N6EMJ3_9EURO|nr:hypothetical protein BDV33DRAFT_137460 [Aspergillus novoparasiticus]